MRPTHLLRRLLNRLRGLWRATCSAAMQSPRVARNGARENPPGYSGPVERG